MREQPTTDPVFKEPGAFDGELEREGWECSSCGVLEYTLSVSEEDLQRLRCSSCGESEFTKREDRTIAEYGEPNEIDTAYIRRKLQLAGEMKTAIKRFLDHHELDGNYDYRRRTRAMRHAMEDYLNCEPPVNDIAFPSTNDGGGYIQIPDSDYVFVVSEES